MKELILNLQELEHFLDEMNLSSSGNHKLNIIGKYKDNEFIKKIFHYTYNTYKKYGVHTKILKKNSNLIGQNYYEDLFQLLDDLAKAKLTGHSAIIAVNSFISQLPQDLQKYVHYILDHDLRMGASLTSIIKIHPDIIPVFKVALAHPYSPDRTDFINGEYYASRKLDGARVICRKEGNSISFFSRTGKEFLTLGKVEEDLKNLTGDFVLDGELCIIDDHGKEDFQGIMKEIRKKDHTISNPKFLIFDCLTLDEFENAHSKIPLIERLNRMPVIVVQKNTFDTLSLVEQIRVKDNDHFIQLAKEAESHGYEGLMIRKNSDYEGKRSHNLLKVKKFYDAEYIVIDAINGPMRWTEGGKQIEKTCLSSIIIEHRGSQVSVGSGFSKEQREYYLNRHHELIGKAATIQYFEESQNVNGGYSLRFPVIKHIYDGIRDM